MNGFTLGILKTNYSVNYIYFQGIYLLTIRDIKAVRKHLQRWTVSDSVLPTRGG